MRLIKYPSLGVWVALLGVGIIFIPIGFGLRTLLLPVWDRGVWQQVWLDNQWPLALRTTLIVTIASSLLALLLALLIAGMAYQQATWQRIQRQLPWLLAFPHAAFAIGIAFLFAPSGWIARLLAAVFAWQSPPYWITIQDPYGVSLLLALTIKESWFLLWVLGALLATHLVNTQRLVVQSMGYGYWAFWWQVIVPQLLPRLGWPLLIITAYSLSVVDMALILGPSTPPSLAVLAWQWLSDADQTQQSMGTVLALWLVGILLLLAGMAFALWWLGKQYWLPQGKRYAGSLPLPCLKVISSGVLSSAWLVLLLLALWSVAGTWFFPQIWPQNLQWKTWLTLDWQPLITSLWLGLAAMGLSLPIALCWLEWIPRRFNVLLYLPLLLPQLLIAAAQYSSLLYWQGDGQVWGVIWSHLAFVLPYTILVLSGAYYAFDQRMVLSAKSLGYSHWQACLWVKWPLLRQAILAAMAVSFSVSIALYLPTLFAGGGRFDTVTTEAVALSAGGNRRTLAVQALLQALLPLLGFILVAMISRRRC